MELKAISAVTYFLLTFFAILFQLALASGLPWGKFAMGGKFPGKLPKAMRIACVVQAAFLFFLSAAVLAHADLFFKSLALPTWFIWVPVGFSGVGLVLNSITPSLPERRLWAPVTLVLFLTGMHVALSYP